MKNKLRRIIINNNIYYYRFIHECQRVENDYKWTSYFKIYVSGNKNTPLTIIVETADCYILGNPLNVGIDGVNLNRPAWARKLILFGIDQGWEGQKKVDLKCSYQFLKQI